MSKLGKKLQDDLASVFQGDQHVVLTDRVQITFDNLTTPRTVTIDAVGGASKLDSSKEFEQALPLALESMYLSSLPVNNLDTGEQEPPTPIDEAIADKQAWLLKLHHKATQARAREVLERLKATSFLSTSSFNGMLAPIPMVLVEAIDAELNRVEGDRQ